VTSESAAGAARTRCIALSGGVGGAKLALGLSRILDPPSILVVANCGDDFDHLGLRVCPDLDTLTYTLAGIANSETGWGIANDTGSFMNALAALGGETWFHLGDKDLATHVERTRRLAAGETLSEVTAAITRRLGIETRIIPMSDDPVATVVETATGPLAFQHYFVREQCAPVVTGFRFEGAASARPQPSLVAALGEPDLEAVIICPSNPFISIDPILAIPGFREALAEADAPVVAVSPIVAGKAIKGPTAKMMAELGIPVAAQSVARRYAGFARGFVLDHADEGEAGAIRALGLDVLVTETVMRTLDDRAALAEAVMRFARVLT
jgi:LPPG:FO 2-phospho-L-lactate transferase